jgi:hypothetical protein
VPPPRGIGGEGEGGHYDEERVQGLGGGVGQGQHVPCLLRVAAFAVEEEEARQPHER